MNWLDEDEKERNLSYTALLKRLMPYLGKHSFLLVSSLGCVLIASVSSLAVPWILGRSVDIVLVNHQMDRLFFFAMVLLGTDAAGAFTTYLHSYGFTLLGQKILHELRHDLLRQYEFYPVIEFDRTPTGRLVTRLINDTSNLQDLFTSGFAISIGNIFLVIGIIIWLIILNPILGFATLCVFPFMIWAARFFGHIIRQNSHRVRSALSKLNSILAETISGMNVIQLLNREVTFRERFIHVANDYTKTQVSTIQTFAYFQPVITLLSSLTMSILIGYGGFLAIRGEVSMGLLVSFMTYLNNLYTPIRDLTEKYNLFLSAMTSCERVFEFLERPTEIPLHSKSTELVKPIIHGKIEFQHVCFRYDVEKGPDWILSDIHFTADPGEKIGIVGYTGAGKTTLASLLLAFYHPQKGHILIDERPLDQFKDIRSWRSSIGFIQQDPILFSGTIADNIFLWDESKKMVFESLPEFAKNPFLSHGPLRMDKDVLEKGANLSMGERQMIAFMRCLLQNPSIFIFDEASAHLDSISEEWIMKVANFSFKDKTVFMIAHRLSTLRSVERMIVLHHGKLVEMGTHQQLVVRDGIYRKLYEMQIRKEALEG